MRAVDHRHPGWDGGDRPQTAPLALVASRLGATAHASWLPGAPRRWVVERTFAWLGRSRRLSKDYEALPETEEAWIYVAMSRLMVARLAP